MKLFLSLMLWVGVAFAAPFPAVPSGPILVSAQVTYPASAIAPLYVFFDLTNTHSSDLPGNGVGIPFLDLHCLWDFDDAGSGDWAYGAHVGTGSPLASRNRAEGLVAAHVYETPGVKRPTVSCTDGTVTKNYSLPPFTVRDPNTAAEFAGTNTHCIAASTLPVAGTDGCPAGATVHNLTVEFGSADFDQALTAYATSNRRLLFKHDDVFDFSNSVDIKGTTGHVGMYGTGAKPDIIYSGSLVNVLGSAVYIGTSAGEASDWRFVDLRIGGTGVTSRTNTYGSGGHANHVLILRNDFHDLGGAASFAHNSLDLLNDVITTTTTPGPVSVGDTVLSVVSAAGVVPGMQVALQSTSGANDYSVKNIPDYRGMFVTAVDTASTPDTITISQPIGRAGPSVGTTMSVMVWNVPHNPTYKIYDQLAVVDSTAERILSGIALYPTGKKVAILGNYLNDSNYAGSEFIMRVPYIGKGMISNNTMSNPKDNKSLLTLRAPPFPGTPTYGHAQYTQYVMVNGNKFVAGVEANSITIMPKNEESDERHRYVRFANNLLIAGVNTAVMLGLNNSNTDVIENNIFDMSNAPAGTAIAVGGATTGASPPNYRARVFNNTIVKRSASPTCTGIGSDRCGGFVGIQIGVGSTGVLVANNLVYAPLATSNPPGWFAVSPVRDLSAGGTVGAPGTHGNSSDVQMIGTNPNFVNASGTWAAPADYRPACTGTTYPCGQGISIPVWKDFLMFPTTSRDIGALTH